MKSLEELLDSLIAKARTAPTLLQRSENPEVDSAQTPTQTTNSPQTGGVTGLEPCGYSGVGVNDPNFLWGHRDGTYNTTVIETLGPYSGCKPCEGDAPPAFCKCLAAYNNPCYNWHWSNGRGNSGGMGPHPTWDPPAYRYPAGCESAEMLDGPGYGEAEWEGNPDALTGQKYRWSAWDYLTRTKNGDSWRPGGSAGGWPLISNYGNANPLDPDALASEYPVRMTMREYWQKWFASGALGASGKMPTLRQRKMMDAGCFGMPGQNGSCCTAGDGLGTNECNDGITPEKCTGSWSSMSCAERDFNNCNPSQGLKSSGQEQKEPLKELMEKVKKELLKNR